MSTLKFMSLARLSTATCRRFSSCAASRITVSPAASTKPSSSSSSSPRLLCQQPTTPRRGLTAMTMRSFSSSRLLRHRQTPAPKPGEELHVTFVDKEGHKHKFAVCEGENLLDVAQANDIEMEGACGGSCACSTCHVIVTDEALYDKMREPDDDENDMLDLAFGLTETSRLGCQIKMTKELDGLVVKLPTMTRNMQASDFR